MRIDSSGNVAVGTTTADAAVTVYKSADSLDGVSIRQNSAGSSAGARLKFGNNSDTRDAEIVLTGSGNSSYAGARTLNFVSNIGGFGFYRSYTTPVATMVLDTSGNVGINTTSGNEKLNVHGAIGSSSPSAGFGAGLERIIMDYTGTVARVGHVNGASGSAKPVTFLVAGAERVRIDTSGNVGIGTSSVATNLHVYEDTLNGTINNIALLDAGNQSPSVAGSGVAMDFRSGNGASYFGAVGGYSDGTNYVAGLWGGAAASGAPDLVVNNSGNVGIGDTTPSYKLDVTGDINFTGTLYENGSPFGGGRTYGTPVTLSGVSSVTFSGIPAGTERIEISIWDIDFATSDTLCTQLGDSGGIETSGYVNQVSSYAEQDDSGTDKFRHKTSGSTTQGMAGLIQYSRVSGNRWAYKAILTGNRHDFSAGRKELSGELTQIKLFGNFGYNMTGYARISYE